TRAVCVRATGAKVGASYAVTAKAARVCGCRCKRMLTPGLADLFESLIVSGAATHSVEILRNKRMIVVGQRKPIHVDRSFVTGVSTQSQTDAAIDRTTIHLHEVKQLAHDDIRAGNGPNARLVQRR